MIAYLQHVIMAAAADDNNHQTIFVNARHEIEHDGIIVTAVGVYEEGAAYIFHLENTSLFARHWRQIRYMFQASPFTIVNNEILMVSETDGVVRILPNETYRVFMDAVDVLHENDDIIGFFLILNRITIFCGTA